MSTHSEIYIRDLWAAISISVHNIYIIFAVWGIGLLFSDYVYIVTVTSTVKFITLYNT